MKQNFKKTVIIVGAGASKEFGLLVGTELQRKIAHLTLLQHDPTGFSPYSHNDGFVELIPRVLDWGDPYDT